MISDAVVVLQLLRAVVETLVETPPASSTGRKTGSPFCSFLIRMSKAQQQQSETKPPMAMPMMPPSDSSSDEESAAAV